MKKKSFILSNIQFDETKPDLGIKYHNWIKISKIKPVDKLFLR